MPYKNPDDKLAADKRRRERMSDEERERIAAIKADWYQENKQARLERQRRYRRDCAKQDRQSEFAKVSAVLASLNET